MRILVAQGRQWCQPGKPEKGTSMTTTATETKTTTADQTAPQTTPAPQTKGRARKGKGKGKAQDDATLAAKFALDNSKATGRAAGNIAAQAAAVPGVLAIAVKAGMAVAPMAGQPHYKPAPAKGQQGGYRAASAALGVAMYKASNGKGFQAHQFKAALLALAPGAYKGGQWHSWLAKNGYWQAA